jgi:hypothetical protein
MSLSCQDKELYIKNMNKLRKWKPKHFSYCHGGIDYKPDTLIEQVIETSKSIGKAILHVLKKGEPEDTIIAISGKNIEPFRSGTGRT